MSNNKILPSERISNEIRNLFSPESNAEGMENVKSLTNDFLSALIKKSTIKIRQSKFLDKTALYVLIFCGQIMAKFIVYMDEQTKIRKGYQIT